MAATRRTWIRIALVAGILASGAVLVSILMNREEGAAPVATTPLLARTTMQVQLVDPDGRPVSGAQVYLLRRPGEKLQETWSPESAVLSIGGATGPRTVMATARGFLLTEVAGITGNKRITMEEGLAVRLTLRNAPRALEERHIRFLLRIRPHEDLVASTPGMTSAALVDLMTHTAGRRSGPRGLPRGEFGYAVSRTQASKGIRVPKPGRYRVHWGLMDLKAGTWFSLGDECGRAIPIEKDDEHYVLDVTEGHLDKTLEGLKTSVNRLDAGED